MEYPKHYFRPKELLTFVMMKGFDEDLDRLGLHDEDLAAIQVIIMTGPKLNEVIKGTGGLRKLRYAAKGKSGKRKAVRVCYAYFEDFEMVLLIVAYAKNEADDISPSDREYFRQLLRRQKASLAKGPKR